MRAVASSRQRRSSSAAVRPEGAREQGGAAGDCRRQLYRMEVIADLDRAVRHRLAGHVDGDDELAAARIEAGEAARSLLQPLRVVAVVRVVVPLAGLDP